MLYDRQYPFASTKAEKPGGFEGPGPLDLPEDVGPSQETKPYIPPTDPEDLMKVLDAPMGG